MSSNILATTFFTVSDPTTFTAEFDWNRQDGPPNLHVWISKEMGTTLHVDKNKEELQFGHMKCYILHALAPSNINGGEFTKRGWRSSALIRGRVVKKHVIAIIVEFLFFFLLINWDEVTFDENMFVIIKATVGCHPPY